MTCVFYTKAKVVISKIENKKMLCGSGKTFVYNRILSKRSIGGMVMPARK